MVASANKCDVSQLEKLLSDELSELEEARATDHVEQCSTCRTRLEELAANGEWWTEASELLHGSRWNQDGTLWLTSNDFNEPKNRLDSAITSLDFLDPSDSPAMLGQLGEYEIMEVIGSGGFGIVLKGYDRELNRYVAVKVLAPHLAHNAAARKRFAREAQAAAAVVHPHVVAIHTIEATGKLPYLVMPLIAGESLQERLDREGPLDAKEILRIGLQVAQGLAAAHAQGVVHRDVKPANILLERGVDRVMLTDFGLARAMDDAALTRSTVIAGTPQYMSPEQAQGDAIDQRTDLFSLGSVMYAMCTGHPPFRAGSLMGILRRISSDSPRDVREINSDLPGWLSAIIAKLHVIDADQRFQTAAELATLLEQCLAHLQQPTLQPLPVIPGTRASSRHRLHEWVWATVATSMLLVTVGVGFGLRTLWNDEDNLPPELTASASAASTPKESADPESVAKPPRADELDWRDGIEIELIGIDQSLQTIELMSPPVLKLEVLKTTPDEVYVGDRIRFTIVVTNTGDSDLTNVRVIDIPDPNLQPVEGSGDLPDQGSEKLQIVGDNIVWNVPTLGPNRSIKLQLVCAGKSGPVTAANTVQVTADNGVQQVASTQFAIAAALTPPPGTPANAQPPVGGRSDL